jgi:Leu/Phe-tRNA-protein transferase
MFFWSTVSIILTFSELSRTFLTYSGNAFDAQTLAFHLDTLGGASPYRSSFQSTIPSRQEILVNTSDAKALSHHNLVQHSRKETRPATSFVLGNR